MNNIKIYANQYIKFYIYKKYKDYDIVGRYGGSGIKDLASQAIKFTGLFKMNISHTKGKIIAFKEVYPLDEFAEALANLQVHTEKNNIDLIWRK